MKNKRVLRKTKETKGTVVYGTFDEEAAVRGYEEAQFEATHSSGGIPG